MEFAMIPNLVSRKRRRYHLLPTSRAALVAAIHRHKPWNSNTGPRTFEGKMTSRLNAMKHGVYGRFARMFHDTAAFRAVVMQVRALTRAEHDARSASAAPIETTDSKSSER
jgi:hypothetical protein